MAECEVAAEVAADVAATATVDWNKGKLFCFLLRYLYFSLFYTDFMTISF